MLDKIPHDQFIKELRCLRMHLAPVMTEKNISILKEAERRLTGERDSPVKFQNRQRNQRKPTKAEAYTKFLLK